MHFHSVRVKRGWEFSQNSCIIFILYYYILFSFIHSIFLPVRIVSDGLIFSCRSLPRRLKDKALIVIILLLLRLEQYRYSARLLMSDLKLSPRMCVLSSLHFLYISVSPNHNLFVCYRSSLHFVVSSFRSPAFLLAMDYVLSHPFHSSDVLFIFSPFPFLSLSLFSFPVCSHFFSLCLSSPARSTCTFLSVRPQLLLWGLSLSLAMRSILVWLGTLSILIAKAAAILWVMPINLSDSIL